MVNLSVYINQKHGLWSHCISGSVWFSAEMLYLESTADKQVLIQCILLNDQIWMYFTISNLLD